MIGSANPLKTLRRMSAVSIAEAKALRTRASWKGWNGATLPSGFLIFTLIFAK